jgi:hypothetical protein
MAGLARADEKRATYRRFLALADYRCATLARRQADAAAADRCDRECLRLRAELAAADPESERRAIELLLVRSRTDDHRDAATAVAEMERKPNLDREVLVELAQCYSQMAARLTPDDRFRARYLDRGVGLIRRALDQGYTDMVLLETDPDLEAIREAPGFKEAAAAAGPKPGG